MAPPRHPSAAPPRKVARRSPRKEEKRERNPPSVCPPRSFFFYPKQNKTRRDKLRSPLGPSVVGEVVRVMAAAGGCGQVAPGPGLGVGAPASPPISGSAAAGSSAAATGEESLQPPELAPTCFRCGLSGHKATKCPARPEKSTCSRSGRWSTEASRGRCWVCDAAEQRAAQCPQASAGSGWESPQAPDYIVRGLHE